MLETKFCYEIRTVPNRRFSVYQFKRSGSTVAMKGLSANMLFLAFYDRNYSRQAPTMSCINSNTG
jgi:hypothetical protein